MKPLDPRDPKNLPMYDLLFCDEDENRAPQVKRPTEGNAFGCLLTLIGLLLLVLAVGMWH